MLHRATAIYKKHREVILYVFFGGMTTLVNIAVYTALAGFPENFPFFSGYRPLLSGEYANVAATVIAWVVSVMFAYVTNKIWVFESRTTGFAALFTELCSFVAARLFSGLLDVGIMYVAVDLMELNNLMVKTASNVLVIILNYIFSKIFIFKKGQATK